MKSGQIRQMARQAVDNLISAVEAGKSEHFKAYLAAMGRFHRYSFGNQLLIHLQKADAKRVAGFHTWKKLGRQVKKGEKAIRILAPVLLKLGGESTELKRILREDIEEKVVTFRSACVFDVSQTDGKPLAEFAKVCGNPGIQTERLRCLITGKGIKLEYSNAIGPAQGLSTKGRIILREDLDQAEEFSTMAHELAHLEMLHQAGKSSESKTVRETEAEAVAFVVCQAIGLDANDSASDYIQMYDGNKGTLMESLERIQQTASEIIRGIQPVKKAAA